MLKNKLIWRLGIIITASVIISVIAAYYFLDVNQKKEMFERLERDAKITLAVINVDRIESVAATYSDTSEDFNRLRAQLLGLDEQFRIDGVDTVYTMKRNGNRIEFLVDSTSLDDPEYVGPGDTYINPPDEILSVFQSGKSVFVGPYTDEYGRFYSYFTPIRRLSDDQIISVLGIDIETSYYQNALNKKFFFYFFIILIIYILAVLLLLFIDRLKYSRQKIREEKRMDEKLANLLPDIFYLLDKERKMLFWNKSFLDKIGIDGEKASKLVFTDLFGDLDKKKVEVSLRNAEKNKYDIVAVELKNKLFELYHTPLKREDGEIIGIAGSGHDISLRYERETSLAKQQDDLKKLNNLMVGRELKMLELKKEISNLRARLEEKKEEKKENQA